MGSLSRKGAVATWIARILLWLPCRIEAAGEWVLRLCRVIR